MDNVLYCEIENKTHCSSSVLYLSIVLSFQCKFMSKFCQELWDARIITFGIHIKNELLCCRIETQAHCSYSSIFIHISFFNFFSGFVS